jgi:transglutaminase-like putative cysteine protease
MFGQTLVRSNVRLPGPRQLGRLVVRLRQKDPGLGWPDFEGPGQSVLGRDKGVLLLEVRQVKPGKSAEPDGVPREYREANALVQSDDAEVRRIAREVAGGEADAYRAACRLRDWVGRNLKLDLGIALAPASEVIRQRGGTCAAYAVALAALTRAAGIPSRVVMGYAYVSGIWGGHAWVEVHAGGQWVPLDAALASPGPADAARIGCVRTSLAEGPGPLLASLGRLFGNVQVAVVEYEVAGVATEVPESARPFAVEGDVYRNDWLGLGVRKPAGWRFAKMDAVYPDSTVVSLRGPGGERVDVHQVDGEAAAVLRGLGCAGEPAREEVAGRTILVADRGKNAGLAFAAGPDLWVLTAEGEHAGELLRRAAGWLTLRRAGR